MSLWGRAGWRRDEVIEEEAEQLGPGAEAQLAVEVLAVILHRAAADAEFGGDLLASLGQRYCGGTHGCWRNGHSMQDIPRGNAHSEQASTVAPYERDQ